MLSQKVAICADGLESAENKNEDRNVNKGRGTQIWSRVSL